MKITPYHALSPQYIHSRNSLNSFVIPFSFLFPASTVAGSVRCVVEKSHSFSRSRLEILIENRKKSATQRKKEAESCINTQKVGEKRRNKKKKVCATTQASQSVDVCSRKSNDIHLLLFLYEHTASKQEPIIKLSRAREASATTSLCHNSFVHTLTHARKLSQREYNVIHVLDFFFSFFLASSSHSLLTLFAILHLSVLHREL